MGYWEPRLHDPPGGGAPSHGAEQCDSRARGASHLRGPANGVDHTQTTRRAGCSGVLIRRQHGLRHLACLRCAAGVGRQRRAVAVDATYHGLEELGLGAQALCSSISAAERIVAVGSTTRSRRSGLISPVAARMPNALGKSNAAPSFRRSAGARLTVIRSIGNSKPALRMAARIRSRLSRTVESGSPTVAKQGSPGVTSTSTETAAASTPHSVAERTRASMGPVWEGPAGSSTRPE